MKKHLSILLLGALAFAIAMMTSCETDSGIEAEKYSINVVISKGGSIEAAVNGNTASKALKGDEVTLTAIPDDGYTFGRWIIESGSVELSDATAITTTFTMPAEEISVKAEFISDDAPAYTITLTDDGNGTATATIDGNTVTEAQEGVEVTITATPGEDHIFNLWVVEGGEVELSNLATDRATFTMPAGDVTIKAQFVEGVLNVFDKITDPTFLMVCKEAYDFDTNNDGILSMEEAAAVTEIKMNDIYTLESLAGIEYFTGLVSLECYSSCITEVDFSKNTELVNLHVGTNYLTALDLSHNTKLVYLYCNRNPILELDLSMLPNLAVLYFHDCTELASLDLSHNPKLKYAEGAFTYKLASLDVSNNPALEYLSVTHTLLSSLDVSSCTAMATLRCSDAKLTALDVSRNAALKELDCGGNQLTSINISNNPSLETIYCYNNQLSSLDVSKNPALWNIACYNNRMTELDASNMSNPDGYYILCGIQTSDGTNPQPISLTLRDEQEIRWYSQVVNYQENANVTVAGSTFNVFEVITDPVFRKYCEKFDSNTDGILSPEEAEAVNSIVVQNMGITSLDGIEYFKSTKALVCPGNEITSLALENLTQLVDLICNNNKLTSLDLPKGDVRYVNESLKNIDCSNNQLSELVAGHCIIVEKISCANNQLTRLQLPKAKLTSLICSNNKLTNIGLEGATALNNLECHTNLLTSLDDELEGLPIMSLVCFNNRMTNLNGRILPSTYQLFCGQQTSDGTTPQTLTLTLRGDQLGQWDNLKNAIMNSGVVLAN